jgi:rubrerythrin
MRKNTPADADASPIDAIRKALERENAASRSYAEYGRIATQPEIRELFLYLAEEEKKHARLLTDEIEKETFREM